MHSCSTTAADCLNFKTHSRAQTETVLTFRAASNYNSAARIPRTPLTSSSSLGVGSVASHRKKEDRKHGSEGFGVGEAL